MKVTKYNFKCSDCNKSFASQQALDQHVQSKHKKDVQGKKSSSSEREKQKHSETNKVKCPHCGKLRSKKGLKEHIANVHEFKCAYCSERFISQKLLQKHIEENHKEKIVHSFVCHICKKVLKSKDALFQHLRIMGHHLESVETPGCPQCNEEFKTKGDLLTHLIRTKHNLLHPPSRDDNFPCPLCDKVFTSSKSLTQHISMKHKESQKIITINKKGIALFEKQSVRAKLRTFLKKIIPDSLPMNRIVIMDENIGKDSTVIDALDEFYDVKSLPKGLMGQSALDIRLACKEKEWGLISKDIEMVLRAQEMKITPVYLLSERGNHRDLIRISKRSYRII
jgi:uncharacterized C2H2 Zn-finger protein